LEVSPAEFSAKVTTYFEGVDRDVFSDDPAANSALAVEVVGVGMAHDTPVVVLIAPWTLCGLAIPPDGRLPTSLRIGPANYPVLRNDVDAIGSYFSVILVPDVSGYLRQQDVRAVAEPLAEKLRVAVEKAREELTEVADRDRRSLLLGATPRSGQTRSPATAFGNPLGTGPDSGS
jgi:hypothetical protein